MFLLEHFCPFRPSKIRVHKNIILLDLFGFFGPFFTSHTESVVIFFTTMNVGSGALDMVMLPEKINNSSEEDSVSSRKSSMESVISTDYSSAMTDVNSELEVAATTPNSSSSSGSQEGNNNSLPKEISCAELELLKKLEEQNR